MEGAHTHTHTHRGRERGSGCVFVCERGYKTDFEIHPAQKQTAVQTKAPLPCDALQHTDKQDSKVSFFSGRNCTESKQQRWRQCSDTPSFLTCRVRVEPGLNFVHFLSLEQ